MKNSTQYAKKVSTLLRKLSPGKARSEPGADDPIGVLIYSFPPVGVDERKGFGWVDEIARELGGFQ